MHLLAVNFHYVDEENTYPHAGIHPVPVPRLRAQLEALGRAFEFVSQADLVAALDGRAALPERACLVTFDDGLACQYANAVPLLEAMGVPAVFFVCGMPLAERRVLSVHKVHWLRATTAPAAFEQALGEEYGRRTGRPFRLDEFGVSTADLRAAYPYDSDRDARVKLILSRVLALALRDGIVDGLFARRVDDEGAFCGSFYMRGHQVADLYRRGWLGVHGYSHAPLSALPVVEVEAEYARCLEALAGAAGGGRVELRGVSYPHGYPGATSVAVARVAGRAGFAYGLTMEASFNRSLREPLLLARLDANDAPGGKTPRFRCDDGNIVATDPALAEGRRQYVTD